MVISWPEKDKRGLYNLDDDYSQSKNLAGKNPKKLAELKDLFDKEAAANHVYPIGASMYTVFFNPSEMPSSPLTKWTLYAGQDRISEAIAPKFASGRSSLAIIDAEIAENLDRSQGGEVDR